GAGGGHPAPLAHVPVEGGEALLAVAVDVVGAGVAGLGRGLEEGLEERAGGRATLEGERAGATAPGVRAGGGGLHPLEVGQAVGVVPVLHAGEAGPLVEVTGVAA